MIANIKNSIRTLVAKAEEASDSAEAMRYAQAAQNLAHAVGVLSHSAKHDEPEMVPAEPDDMNAALVQIAQELGCECNIDDILHAIDRLKE